MKGRKEGSQRKVGRKSEEGRKVGRGDEGRKRKEGRRFCLCPTNGQTELHKEMAISPPAWEVITISVISRSCCGQFVGAIACSQ